MEKIKYYLTVMIRKFLANKYFLKLLRTFTTISSIHISTLSGFRHNEETGEEQIRNIVAEWAHYLTIKGSPCFFNFYFNEDLKNRQSSILFQHFLPTTTNIANGEGRKDIKDIAHKH